MNLNEKLSHIQKELKAPKNLRNTFGKYNYRNAEGILEALKPYLEKYKVAVTLSDDIKEIGGRVYVEATAYLHDCENADKYLPFKVTAYAREPEDKKGMDDSQITGSTSSYARKYALNGLFLLDDTKDADSDEAQVESDARAEKERVSLAKSHNALLDVLKKEGIKADFVVALYKVNSFQDLSEKQIKNISQHLEDIKKKQEEKHE